MLTIEPKFWARSIIFWTHVFLVSYLALHIATNHSNVGNRLRYDWIRHVYLHWIFWEGEYILRPWVKRCGALVKSHVKQFHLVLIVFRKKWPLFDVLPDYCSIEVDVRCTMYLVSSIPTVSIWCCTDVPKSFTISWNKIPCSSFYIIHQLTFQGLLSASWHKKVNSEVLMNSSFLRAHRSLFGCGFHEESEYSIVEVIEVLYNGIIIIGWWW